MLSPRIKRKKNWTDKGVSEVVGTILILAITVVLFASIMTFVMNMPVPNNTPIADFKATLSVSGNVANLILTHNGGESIFNYRTQIQVFNGTVLNTYTIANGGITLPTSNPTWSIGQTWTSPNLNIKFTPSKNYIGMTTKVDVDIVDTSSNSMIWSSRVGTGQSTDAPVILQRWVDSDPSTLTPDPIHASDTKGFTFYVRVANVNNAPDVYVDGSSINVGLAHVTGTMTGGVWSFVFSPVASASTLDGRPLFIHAQNTKGTASETYVLTVQTPDITNYRTNITYNGTMPTSDSGLPSYLKWFDSDQGYVVLGADVKSGTPPRSPNLTDARSTFIQGEYVFVRVGSFKLQNTFAKNNLTLVNRLSGTSTNPCGNSTPFYRVPSSGGVFIYEAKFSTASLSLLGEYDMQIDLQSTVTSGSTLISFNAVSPLIVQPATGPHLVLPDIRVNATNPLNKSALQFGTHDAPFDLSDASKSIIWVDLKFLDAGAGSTLKIGNVMIKDFRDRTVLAGVPPVPPVSNGTLGCIYSNLTKDYVFKIDLRLLNGYNLVPGEATYTLTILNAFDSNEGLYTMSLPIWIKSATSQRDYIVATSGYGGSGNFNDISYLFQIDNNKFFTTQVLEKVAMTPSTQYTDIQTYRTIYFDIDGDGDRDVVASMNTPAGYGFGVYINRMNEYGIWEPKSFYLSPDPSNPGANKITALAYGDVDGDGAQDWVVATTAGHIYLYYNTFPVSTQVLLTTPETNGKVVLEMRLADMTGDGKADLVILVGASERTNTAKGQIFIYDLSSGNAVRLPVANVNTDTNVFDFDVADINHDGYNDYATSSSTRGIGWYQAVPTTNTYLASADIAGGTGTVVNTYTATQSSGGLNESITESGGTANHVWQMQALAGSSPTLRIDAMVNNGCTENFYFYYSTAQTGPWTFMFSVPPSTVGSYHSFYQTLRSGLTGTIYIKVADSVSGDSSANSIYVDFIQISTISGMTFNPNYHALRTDADSLTYPAIGIGNFNGDGTLDIAVEKDGKIMIVNGIDGTIMRTDTTADIRATGDTFVVADVNGDNLADIVYVLRYTETLLTGNPDSYSIVNEWINTANGAPPGTVIQIKQLSQSYGPSASSKSPTKNYGPDAYGAINCISAENPYG